MSVEARSNCEDDNVVGILQIERKDFKGADAAVVIDTELAKLREALLAFVGIERTANRLSA